MSGHSGQISVLMCEVLVRFVDTQNSPFATLLAVSRQTHTRILLFRVVIAALAELERVGKPSQPDRVSSRKFGGRGRGNYFGGVASFLTCAMLA